MVGLFSDEERARIHAAITAAEARTTGEVFCVAARRSDEYRYVPLVWAALFALSASAPILLFTDWSRAILVVAQVGIFGVLAAILQIERLRMALVPERLVTRRVRRHAIAQFMAHGIHTTPDRTGLLLFLSLAERRAEVVADEGLHAAAPPEVWEEAALALAESAASGAPADGFVAAIGIVADLMAEHFPGGADDHSRLGDHLVEFTDPL